MDKIKYIKVDKNNRFVIEYKQFFNYKDKYGTMVLLIIQRIVGGVI